MVQLMIDPATTWGPKTVVAIFAYGGIFPQTFSCIMRDATRAATISAIAQYDQAITAWQVAVHVPPGDALIDRSRAIVAQRFLESTDAEVLLMVDHDIEWMGASKEYEGDLCHLARKCHETKGIVGGLVAKKSRGQGVAVIWEEDGEYDMGVDRLIKVHYVGSAFTAYHRHALEAVTKKFGKVSPGFAPIFLPMLAPHPLYANCILHLSEDWAFCQYCKELGIPTYASLRPLLIHHGNFGYGISDSNPDKPILPPMPRCKISLLHASRGRPVAAKEAKNALFTKSSGKHDLEYILSIDADDPALSEYKQCNDIVIINSNRGNVDAYNHAMKIATGDIYLQVHDDVEPPTSWDELIVARIANVKKPAVLALSDGGAINPQKPWLIPILCGTANYFIRAGYFFSPEYISIFCDDDASLKAYHDGIVIDGHDIQFKHNWKGPSGDATYARSYQKINWEVGGAALMRRMAAGFPDIISS